MSARSDYWGTQEGWLSCGVRYAGLVTVAYAPEDGGAAAVATSRSSDHAGDCSGSTSRACAADFVSQYSAGARAPCFVDPDNPDTVIFERGWTVWRWCLTLVALGVALGGCGMTIAANVSGGRDGGGGAAYSASSATLLDGGGGGGYGSVNAVPTVVATAVQPPAGPGEVTPVPSAPPMDEPVSAANPF